MDDFLIKDIGGVKKLFSKKNFNINQVILKLDGINIKKVYVDNLPKEVSIDFLQIDKELYLDLSNHFSFFINHNCNPNAFVKTGVNNAFLLATRDIQCGDEIVIDYSITSSEDASAWSIGCNCHQFYCRKNISGFNSLPENIKNKYISMGIVPSYILA